MIFEVRVASRNKDPKGEDLLAEIKRTLKINSIKKIKTSKVFRLEGLRKDHAEKFTKTVLFEPIDQQVSYNGPIHKSANHLLEVSYKPGVMNPEAASLMKSAKDLKIKIDAADSSTEYAFWGKISPSDLEKITNQLLVNKTIEQVVKKSPKTLIISGKPGKTKIIPIRSLNDKELVPLSLGFGIVTSPPNTQAQCYCQQ
jgi:phosphoribosylformylglycinamidine synthase